MKKSFSILIASFLFFLPSCLDLFNNDEIKVGTHGLVLLHSSDMPGYMLAKPIGSSNYQTYIGEVTNVLGNDSILLVDSHRGYFKFILSKLDPNDLTPIEHDEFMALKSSLNIKYNVASNPKYD